jgi:hypothetical protein
MTRTGRAKSLRWSFKLIFKNKIYNSLPYIAILLFVQLFFSCEFITDIDETIIVDTGIEIVSNSQNKILKRAETDYKNDGFYVKSGLDINNIRNEKLFIASTIEELQELQEKYFYLPYLNDFSNEYFKNNYLTLILLHYTGSTALRNEQIIEKEGKYVFTVELWNKIGTSPYVKDVLFVLQLPKKN